MRQVKKAKRAVLQTQRASDMRLFLANTGRRVNPLPKKLYPDFEHPAPASARICASGPLSNSPAGRSTGECAAGRKLADGAGQAPGRALCVSSSGVASPPSQAILAAVGGLRTNVTPFRESPAPLFPKRSDAETLALCVAPGVVLPDFGTALAAVRLCAPSCNTGAQNTQTSLSPQNPANPKPKKNKKKEEQKEELLPVALPDSAAWKFDGFLIDWLRFTVIPEDQQRQFLTTWRGEPDDWTEQNSGHMGYRRCYRSEGVSIYYDHAEEGRGICFDISGKGCRRLEEAGRVAVGAGWTNLLRLLTETPGVNITRLDAAIDDRKGLVDLERVQQCIDTGLVVSRFKSAYGINKQSLSTGEGCGKTINFGSRVSNLMVRMYNKAAEQKLDTGEHWTRVEVEAKDENAVALAMALAEAGAHEAGSVVAGVLRNYLTFRERSDTDTNKSRWLVVAWWDEFLQGVAALRLAVAKQEPTLERLRAWVEKQVAPTLALLFDREVGCYGRSLLDVLVAGGVERLRPKHHKLRDAERRRVALVAPVGGPTGF